MDVPRKPKSPRTARIKAAKALKKLPTALLLKRKAECDAKALRIVEQMIETGVKEDWLLENLGQINRSHMEDIAEERSIVKLCGYPLCDNPLKKVIRKQYQISTLKNKVYDISRVKNFCSYGCYTATEYLAEQMSTSPLWVREDEEIPKFRILPRTQSRSKSPPGVEVDLIGIKLPDDTNEDPETTGDHEKKEKETRKRSFDAKEAETLDREEKNDRTSDRRTNEDPTNESGSKGCGEIDENMETEGANASTASRIPKKSVRFSANTTVMGTEEEETKKIDENRSVVENEEDFVDTIKKLRLTEVEITDEKPQLDIHTKINSKSKADKNESKNRSVESHKIILLSDCPEKQDETSAIASTNSEPCISQPETKAPAEKPKSERRKLREAKKETKIYFETATERVEKCFKEWITEETILLLHGEEIEKRKIIENVHTQEKYVVLCKKLNHLQLEEDREENERIGELKPAPHFSTLQEEAKSMDLKVRAFYEGRTVVDPSANEAANTIKQEDNERETVLPLLDLHAPKALRRRIFLDKLNRVLPDLLRALAGSGENSLTRYAGSYERCAAVKTLVSTFSLSATNITFRTAEWTLVALIIIKLLSCLDPEMKNLLSSKQGSMYVSMILMSFKLPSNYLELMMLATSLPKTTAYEDS